MDNKRLPKGIRKHLRLEKSRIRRQFLDLKEQENKIGGLYKRMGIKAERRPSLNNRKISDDKKKNKQNPIKAKQKTKVKEKEKKTVAESQTCDVSRLAKK